MQEDRADRNTGNSYNDGPALYASTGQILDRVTAEVTLPPACASHSTFYERQVMQPRLLFLEQTAWLWKTRYVDAASNVMALGDKTIRLLAEE